MVVFNDPIPVDNPALQAVQMALEMRVAIGALTEKWRQLGHEIGFGIGLQAVQMALDTGAKVIECANLTGFGRCSVRACGSIFCLYGTARPLSRTERLGQSTQRPRQI
jgi:hypothetical protein